MTSAGWYRDPYGTPGLLRWWDGRQWTQATQPTGEGQAGWNWGAAPQTWTQPGPEPPAQRSSARVPLLVGGGAAVAAVIVVIAVLVATGAFGGGNGGKSPVTSTITDFQAGLSYPRLGGAWKSDTVNAAGGLGKLGFDMGQSATVMNNFENGQPYVASAYSGVVADASSGSLQSKVNAVIAALEPVAYPAHTRKVLTSASHPVNGHDGWLLKVKFSFPQAKSQGWNFRTETAAVVVIDRGNGQRPAEFYVSIPDSHKKQGDLDLLLTSLKVS